MILLSRIVLILCFLCAHTFAEIQKLDVAINDLQGKGLPQSTADIISDRLRSSLLSTNMFRVLERNAMENILKEQGFQQTGTCDEASCLVEAGQLLGVDRMIAGSVGKIENLYSISLRMINVATGEIIYTVNEDYEGSIKGVLSEATINAAEKLAKSAGSEIKEIVVQGKYADIFIQSYPAEASVEIDGTMMEGKTPVTLQGVSAGKHRIVLRAGEYYWSETVNLLPDDLLKLKRTLAKGTGSIKVFSEPANAVVYVDGILSGETPCKLKSVEAGEHLIVVEKDNFFPDTTVIHIGVGELSNYNANLVEASYISVSTEYPTAILIINNKKVGEGNLYNYTAPIGVVHVRIENPGFELWEQTITMGHGENRYFTPTLMSVFGMVSLKSIPTGAYVLINDKKVGMTPYKNKKVRPGTYTLALIKPSYDPFIEEIEIKQNKYFGQEYYLLHTTAYTDSVKAAENYGEKRNQWIRRITFGVGALIAGGLGYFHDTEAQSSLDEYHTYESDNATVHDANWNNYKEQSTYRNISYGISGLFFGGLIISIPF